MTNCVDTAMKGLTVLSEISRCTRNSTTLHTHHDIEMATWELVSRPIEWPIRNQLKGQGLGEMSPRVSWWLQLRSAA